MPAFMDLYTNVPVSILLLADMAHQKPDNCIPAMEAGMEVGAVGPYRRAVQVVAPCVLAVGLFCTIVAPVEAYKASHPFLALLLAVVPTGAWVLVSQRYRSIVRSPAFGPSFLNTVMALGAATLLLKLAHVLEPLERACSITLPWKRAGGALLRPGTRTVWSDPGRLPTGQPPPGGYKVMSQDEWDTWQKEKEAREAAQSKQFSELRAITDQQQQQQPPGLQQPSAELAQRQQEQEEAVKEGGEGGARAGAPQRAGEVASAGAGSVSIQLAALQSGAAHEHARQEQDSCRESTALLIDMQEQPQQPAESQQAPIWDASAFCYECHVRRRNHVLFVGMLLLFILAEDSYVRCSFHCNPLGDMEWWWLALGQAALEECWVVALAVFLALQLLWQVPLLLFHLVCAATNITTNEYATWRRIPSMYIELPPKPGHRFSTRKFVNPYNRGLLRNLRQFFWNKDLEYQ
eukprot:jgi/Mesen1/7026/ME000366S06237